VFFFCGDWWRRIIALVAGWEQIIGVYMFWR